ncbi:MAG: citrate/2-methylcitrate synthase [Eubacterium sp.]|nr:citrate/2-methylcitrate synthase [Eubacterium sp.]
MSYLSSGEAAREIHRLSRLCLENNKIDPQLYDVYQVKKGLREANGKGVLTGLTEISTIHGSKEIDGKLTPIDGELYYRGIDINKLVEGFSAEGRFGYEETVYLLIFGKLPNEDELDEFTRLLSYNRALPDEFIPDVILKSPNKDIMNAMARSILTLNSYDKNSDDLSIPNVLRQSLWLIATLPMIGAYSYLTYRHYMIGRGLYIHNPKPEFSTAENLLRILRQNKSFTPLEAKILDIALVLHAEHGGGNNSTFTTHVVTSSGTDTYSSVAASLCSLKGPKHGGANIKVKNMFDEIKKNVKDWENEDEISEYLLKILRKEAFDKSGLIYGIGHAVYTKSDPRAELMKKYTIMLAEEKDRMDEFKLYENVEKLAPVLMQEERKMYKPVCANIDFYSGFVYNMLGIPDELFTPLFAIARVAGWSAHRIEELICTNKIIRPAYMSVAEQAEYISLCDR